MRKPACAAAARLHAHDNSTLLLQRTLRAGRAGGPCCRHGSCRAGAAGGRIRAACIHGVPPRALSRVRFQTGTGGWWTCPPLSSACSRRQRKTRRRGCQCAAAGSCPLAAVVLVRQRLAAHTPGLSGSRAARHERLHGTARAAAAAAGRGDCVCLKNGCVGKRLCHVARGTGAWAWRHVLCGDSACVAFPHRVVGP